MGDVHIPEPDPSAIGAKVHDLIESGHEFYATALTGSPQGRTRRPVLFIIAGIGLWGAADAWEFSLVGLIAILILALTDAVVEL